MQKMNKDVSGYIYETNVNGAHAILLGFIDTHQ